MLNSEHYFTDTDNGRFRLRDLLSVPMQRILKYHLILRELMVRTPVNHEEYRSTQLAYEAMIDV
jgi:guanine nucleotide exchange factor VAV